MTKSRVPRTWLATAASLTIIVAFASAASAAKNPCIKEAKEDFRACHATCKEDFQATKDACLDRDHACVEVCRALRAECREATGFDAAIDACGEALETARAACRAQHPTPGPARDVCIDQAQVIAFQCRDAAREAAKPALKLCRKSFKDCARACPPDATPTETPRQCVKDAAQTARTCYATCKEEYQLDKDTCRNREHGCVEQCRADRHACKTPIREELESDKAACNATRDAAVDNCKVLYGEGTPERDACIDNAQVEAFQCKDQAREDARPGLQACHQAFRACAAACPPPPTE